MQCVLLFHLPRADMCLQEYVDLHQRYLVRGEQMLNEWQLRKIPRRTGSIAVKADRKVTGSEVCNVTNIFAAQMLCARL